MNIPNSIRKLILNVLLLTNIPYVIIHSSNLYLNEIDPNIDLIKQ